MEVTREPRCVRTVLVVDDDKIALQACAFDLGVDRRVLLATNRPTAMMLGRQPGVDLAIIDERLGPGHLVGAGLELISDFKELRPEMILVLVSAVITRYSEQLAFELGADAVFEKTRDDCGAWIPTAAILAFVEHGTEAPGLDETELKKLARIERDAIVDTLLRTRGNISEAARVLGIARRVLQRKVQALGLGFAARADQE